MGKELHISVAPSEIRAALLDDGILVDLHVEREDRASLVGNIYRGRVDHVSGNVDAAFVDIGLTRAGFLPLSEGGRERTNERRRTAPDVHEGEWILVQVTKDAAASKGVQLTRRVTLPGRFLVYSPTQDRISISRKIDDIAERARLEAVMETVVEPGDGFILRTAAMEAKDPELEDEALRLRRTWRGVVQDVESVRTATCLYGDTDPVARVLRNQIFGQIDRIHVDDRRAAGTVRDFVEAAISGKGKSVRFYSSPHDMFEQSGVNAEIEQALQRHVALPSGGGLVIDVTEALSVIDVNSGSHSGGSHSGQAAFRVNREAANEAARQIRIRNLGGLVVIDFIRMERKEDVEQILQDLRNAVADDPAGVRVHGMTSAGLVELTRRRQRESLLQTMTKVCTSCSGDGYVLSAESVGLSIIRTLLKDARVCPPGPLAVYASKEIKRMLDGNLGQVLEEIRDLTGRRVEVRERDDYAREQFDIHPMDLGC